MSVPKSVIKIKKGEVTYTSNVDRCAYTIKELCRAALRDTGKFVCAKFRIAYYGAFKRRSGRVGRYTQYWVRKRDMDLQVGLKPNGFYGGFQELGTSKTPKSGLLKGSVQENIPKIIEIQSKYLSALEGDESSALALCDENDMEGS